MFLISDVCLFQKPARMGRSLALLLCVALMMGQALSGDPVLIQLKNKARKMSADMTIIAKQLMQQQVLFKYLVMSLYRAGRAQ